MNLTKTRALETDQRTIIFIQQFNQQEKGKHFLRTENKFTFLLQGIYTRWENSNARGQLLSHMTDHMSIRGRGTFMILWHCTAYFDDWFYSKISAKEAKLTMAFDIRIYNIFILGLAFMAVFTAFQTTGVIEVSLWTFHHVCTAGIKLLVNLLFNSLIPFIPHPISWLPNEK